MIAQSQFSTGRSAKTPGSNVAEVLQAALGRTGYAELRSLRIRVDSQVVHLVGKLPSYYLKQMAHHTVLKVPGIDFLEDEIEVVA